MRRERGEAIVRREVWRGEPKVASGRVVVEDTPELLALYMPEGSPSRTGSSGTVPIASSVAGTSTSRSRFSGLAAELDAGRRWWNDDWAEWLPDPGWQVPALLAAWAD